jgi:endonuclease/exonuclease/phosphatase family metal-dependent hydrolase
MPETEALTARPRIRRAVTSLTRLFAFGSAILIAGGLTGQALRDRSVAVALLMYIPLPLVGATALVLDLARKGRSLSRFRFGLSALGLTAVAWSACTMIGPGIVDERRSGDREISVLHWNVQWGGGLFRGPHTWKAQRAAMLKGQPDLIVLSEVPPEDWIDGLVADLGPGASFVGIRHDPTSPYWYRLSVCSRWPLKMERHLTLPGGTGMSVVAEVDGRRVRLLVVDGISSPTRSRRPFLAAIAAACKEANEAGRPFDLVVGDFNSPGRSLGFDELAALGYRLAGRSARGWRGTFPAWLPVYDIDHIWLRAGLRIASSTFFNGPHTDHRGQVVRLLLPEEYRQ